MYMGDAFVSVDDKSPDMNALDRVPGWFICVVNPGAVTVVSFCLAKYVSSFTDAVHKYGKASNWRIILAIVFVRSYHAVNVAKEYFLRKPCFCLLLSLWLAHGIVAWWFLLEEFFGSGLDCSSVSGSSTTSSSTINTEPPSPAPVASVNTASTVSIDDSNELAGALIIASVALAVGFVLMVVAIWMRRSRRPVSIDEPQHSTEEPAAPQTKSHRVNFEESLIPSLLFGWGVGYWITSCLMGGTVYGEGWANRPIALKIAGYMTLPWIFVAVGILMADSDFLGTRFELRLKHTAILLKDTKAGWFWILATVIRDSLFIWLFMWYTLVPCLNNI